MVYTSLAIGAVVCTTLTHFGAITVTPKKEVKSKALWYQYMLRFFSFKQQ